MVNALPASVDDTHALLAAGDYVGDRSLATALYLSLSLDRPLFLEGEAGVGKTEIAKVLAAKDPAQRARENLVQVLFNHNDFVTIR